jgi:hypothetical protein
VSRKVVVKTPAHSTVIDNGDQLTASGRFRKGYASGTNASTVQIFERTPGTAVLE